MRKKEFLLFSDVLALVIVYTVFGISLADFSESFCRNAGVR